MIIVYREIADPIVVTGGMATRAGLRHLEA